VTGLTQPVGLKPPQTTDEDAVRAGLDLLANGGCDQSAFLESMQQRIQCAPEGTWEVLSQLDQYYRRGKIGRETFQAIKSALAGAALRLGGDPAAARLAAPAARARAPHLKPGDRLRDRYRIESVLGQGGMGTVFEAIDEFRLDAPPSGQRLAIKVLHSAVTTRTELFTELRREFQNLQLLSHPNVVRVFEFDRDGPLAFFTMELLNGALLSRVLLSRKPLHLEHAHSLAVIRDVGAAIAHAHSRGVVHGDINPQNIFITSRGALRVLDFGASNRLVLDPATPDDETKPPRFATPGYASCQVLEGTRPDARDDVFALACVAYRLLCGEHPFAEGSALEARAAGSSARQPAKLSRRQWRVLQEGLHWDREKRPADVLNWLERLDLRAAKALPTLPDLLQPQPAAKGASLLPLSKALHAAKYNVASLRAKALPGALGLAVVLALAGGYWIIRPHQASPSASAAAPIHSAGAAATSGGHTLPPAAAREAAVADADSRAAEGEPAVAPRAAAFASSASPPPAPLPKPALIEMSTATVEVAAGDASARVVVRRKGNLRGETGFTWWTESGTAKPGTDFAPVVPQVERIGDRKTSVALSIPLVGSPRAQARSFYVVIDLPQGNAKLGERSLTMVTLPPAQ
jgi:serine/threonine protein kinase